ncbi:MAG: carbohydrate kinase, partial [Nonomuraea sp.]|nr:carbohydrate kinase [Nonomuraea sp.]
MGAICVDAGTTVIKAVGYDSDGAELAVARRETRVTRPAPGHAEQDMRAVWEAVVSCVREVAPPDGVDFVAITAQGDGAWLGGSDGEPTGPAILWNDGRAASIVEEWAPLAEPAFRISGSSTASGLPNAILAWLARHDPSRLERSAACLTCGGWIFSRMTGVIAADESDASAPFMDLRERHYSPDLLRFFGISGELLPEIRSERVAGLVSSELGLAAGTPVVMAPYDIVSTALGSGAVSAGQACGILGTTISTEIVLDAPELDGEPIGITIAMPEDRYLRAFPTFAGTEVLQWACRLLGLPGPAALTELAATAPPGAGGLAFLPYLSPAGERAPFLDPQARGSLLGMSVEHGREHVARAVLEGLTLTVQDCLAASGRRPHELRVCGGGAASDVWVQLIADVTGLPVIRSADAEVGARGAYLVGLLATGAVPALAPAATRFVR